MGEAARQVNIRDVVNPKSPVSWIAATLGGGLAWAFTTFATIDYVDKRHKEVTGEIQILRSDVSDIRVMTETLYLKETGKRFQKR